MSETEDVLLDEFKPRELEILSLMAAGLSNVAIGEKLHVTKETVRWYNKKIYQKLGTSRRTEAIAKARRHGLIGKNSATVSSPKQRHNLPNLTTPFIGRQQDIGHLRELLAQPNSRLLTLLGPGGMGKTRLAIELGRKLLPHYADGVYLFELAPLTGAEAILGAMLRVLRLPTKQKGNDEQRLIEAINGKKQLLIFDNFEHLLGGAALINRLLQQTTDCQMVVTSRERLNLHGERVHQLKGLQANGEALFLSTAQQQLPAFQVGEAERPFVSDIVRLVGGMPLAIILAAAWVDSLSVAEIAEEISQDLDILSTEMRNVPERQQSIRAVLTGSWEKLTPREQAACRNTAVFQGGFSRRAASKVAGVRLPLLRKLQHKSFVQRLDERRYDLHPLVRQFMLEKLATGREEAETRQAHLTFFLSETKEMLAPLTYGDYAGGFEQVAVEHDNIRAALDWGLGNQQAAEAIALAEEMYLFWDTRSFAREASGYFQQALAFVEQGEPHVRILLMNGRFFNRLNQHERGEAMAEQALQLANELDKMPLRLNALGLLTNSQQELGRFVEMKRHATLYLQLAQEQNDRQQLMKAMERMATAHFGLGDIDQSILWDQKGLKLARELEDDVAVANHAFNLAASLLDFRGDVVGAEALIQESVSLLRLLGDRARVSLVLVILSNISILLHKPDQAQSQLEEALAIADDLGLSSLKIEIFLGFSLYYETQAAWEEGVAAAKKALALARQNGSYVEKVRTPLALARLYLQIDLVEQGGHYLAQAVNVTLEGVTKTYEEELLFVLALYYWKTAAFENSARLLNLYYRRGKVNPLFADLAGRLEAQLKTAVSPDKWAELKTAVSNQSIRPVLQAFLAENN